MRHRRISEKTSNGDAYADCLAPIVVRELQIALVTLSRCRNSHRVIAPRWNASQWLRHGFRQLLKHALRPDKHTHVFMISAKVRATFSTRVGHCNNNVIAPTFEQLLS